MAVTKRDGVTKLLVRVESGTDAKGVPTYKDRTFTHVRQALTDADAFALGTKLGGLQEHPVIGIKRQDVATLAEA